MKIGTDISLETCRIEGYLMMEYRHRELFPSGNNGKLDKDCSVLFTRTNEKTHKTGRYNPRLGGSRYVLEEWRSWNEVLERYLYYKAAIDRCISNEGDGYVDYANLEPNVWDLLLLADTVDGYCGL